MKEFSFSKKRKNSVIVSKRQKEAQKHTIFKHIQLTWNTIKFENISSISYRSKNTV